MTGISVKHQSFEEYNRLWPFLVASRLSRQMDQQQSVACSVQLTVHSIEVQTNSKKVYLAKAFPLGVPFKIK